MEDNNKVAIEMGDKMIVLTIQPFDADIDVEMLLQIDYSNVIGELITFSVVFNRIGVLRADMEEIVANKRLETKVFEAQLQETIRNNLSVATEDSKGVVKVKQPTAAQIENLMLLDKGYQVISKNYIKAQKDLAVIQALYDSARSKDFKLNKFAERIQPSEFEKEIMEGTINNVMIRQQKKMIG